MTGFDWNHWSESNGIGGQYQLEWVTGMDWNMHSLEGHAGEKG
ncbi:MAG: hypothetical protein R6T98_04495 [Desulfatiglandales bacterium]